MSYSFSGRSSIPSLDSTATGWLGTDSAEAQHYERYLIVVEYVQKEGSTDHNTSKVTVGSESLQEWNVPASSGLLAKFNMSDPS